MTRKETDWTIQRPGDSDEYAEAVEILARGLRLLGVKAAEGSSSPDAPIILLNHGSSPKQSFAWRSGEERVEIYGDDARSLIWGIYDFLEAAGLPLPPWPERSGSLQARSLATRSFGTLGKCHARPRFMDRAAVFREGMGAGDAIRWAEWARSRAFTSTLFADSHFMAEEGIDAWIGFITDPRNARAVIVPAPGAGAADTLSAIEAMFRASEPKVPVSLLCRAERALDLAAALEGRGSGFIAGTAGGIGLVLDDGDRCRAHALGEVSCAANAAYLPARLGPALLAWKKAGGGPVDLRLRHDDDELFPALPPPMAQTVTDDLEYAETLGFDGIQFVVSTRKPDRPAVNAWAFSKSAFERTRSGALGAPDPATAESQAASTLLRGFCSSSFLCARASGHGGFNASSYRAAVLMESYYRDMESAWTIALDRAPEAMAASPEEPVHDPGIAPRRTDDQAKTYPGSVVMDPWNESLNRQIERANAFAEAYAFLDGAKERLVSAKEFLSDCRAYAAELSVYRCQELTIELCGMMRALYSEAKEENGRPAGIQLMAEIALMELEKEMRVLYPMGPLRNRARAYLYRVYGFRLARPELRAGSGPVTRLRASIFNLIRKIRFRIIVELSAREPPPGDPDGSSPS